MADDTGKNPQKKQDTASRPSEESAEPQTESTPPPPPEPEPKADSGTPPELAADSAKAGVDSSSSKSSFSNTFKFLTFDDFRKKAAFGSLFLILVTAVFLAGIYYSTFINKKSDNTLSQTSNLPKATLSIVSPENEQAFTISQVEVRGKTAPNSIVTVYSDSYADSFESDSQGNFSGVIALEEGPNELTFVASGDNYEDQEDTRSVVYVRNDEL